MITDVLIALALFFIVGPLVLLLAARAAASAGPVMAGALQRAFALWERTGPGPVRRTTGARRGLVLGMLASGAALAALAVALFSSR